MKSGEVQKIDLKKMLESMEINTSKFGDLWKFFKRNKFVTLLDSNVLDLGKHKNEIILKLLAEEELDHFIDPLLIIIVQTTSDDEITKGLG